MGQERANMHVAIIGCGFTGTSTFYQIVRGYSTVREITIFESTGEFGPGFAYRPDECEDYLINNTTDTMCLGPENRRAFIEWLEQHPELAFDTSPKGHLPRKVYGLFLKDVIATTTKQAQANGIVCRFIAAEASFVEEQANHSVKVKWADGEMEADAVILTTGRCPDIQMLKPPPSTASARYFSNHVNEEHLDELPLSAKVSILGASLSAYDIINRLYTPRTGCRFERGSNGEVVFIAGSNDRHVSMLSRSGRLKKMQSRSPQRIQRQAFTLDSVRKHSGNLTLESVGEAILADSLSNSAQIDMGLVLSPYKHCRSEQELNDRAIEILSNDIDAARTGNGKNFLVDIFDQGQVEMWDGFAARLLSPEEELKYRQSYESAVLTYMAPCPIPTAERLLALMKAGRLQICSGVQTPQLSDDGKFYDLQHDHGTTTTDILINATGKVDRTMTSNRQPDWVKSLVEAGKIQPYKRGGIEFPGVEVDMSTHRPPGLKNVYFANMCLWGPGIFTSSAFSMATIVSRILAELFGE